MPNCWLWPDRKIGKRESRTLREEHNRVVDLQDRTLQLLTKAMAYVPKDGEHERDLRDTYEDLVSEVQ